MKRNYQFFDKESLTPRTILYEFDPPFYSNLDNYLKEIYGSELTFVKEINHADKIIRLHSSYDSGKGTKYIPPLPISARVDVTMREILKKRGDKNVLNLIMEGKDNYMFIFRDKIVEVFRSGSMSNSGHVSGYRCSHFPNDDIRNFLKLFRSVKFYIDKYEWL